MTFDEFLDSVDEWSEDKKIENLIGIKRAIWATGLSCRYRVPLSVAEFMVSLVPRGVVLAICRRDKRRKITRGGKLAGS